MTRQTLATFILLAAMPLAVPAAQPAQDTSRSGATNAPAAAPSMFKELDKNNDGQISRSEAKRSADFSARFSAVDTDGNKQVSLSEWQADERARGAAGVSGESREQGSMKGQSTPSGTTGETPMTNPDTTPHPRSNY
jgi:hypothetical protein